MSSDPYKVAYQREKKARELAERLLNEKTRELYQQYVQLDEAHQHLTATKEKLIQSEKMSSLGQLAAGVAHEINNPLSYSLSNLECLQEYLTIFKALDDVVMEHTNTNNGNNAEQIAQNYAELFNQYLTIRAENKVEFLGQDSIDIIESTIEGLHRIKKITTSLKQVSHQNSVSDSQSISLCDINQCIKNSLEVVWNELKYTMDVSTELQNVPKVMCDDGEIHQVLMNMFLNASYACSKQGILSISTEVQSIDQQEWVVIKIADNGSGIPEENIERIFEPFFTTKPVDKGTGLGLSISLSIIEKHQGKVHVSSQLGHGTVFSIYLKPVQP